MNCGMCAISFSWLRQNMTRKQSKSVGKEDSAKSMLELADVLEAIEDFSIEDRKKVVMDWIAAKKGITRETL